jgi:hypothetical protein
LEIAWSSLKETEEHLVDGFESGVFTKEAYEDAQRYVRRTTAAMAGLMRYLRSTAAEANYQKVIKAEQARPYVNRKNPNPQNDQNP